MPYPDFIIRKIDVALKLADGGCGGGYTESAMILAALSSGISADIWPGEGFDRKRFVELWTRHAAARLGVRTISVPLLTQTLRSQQNSRKIAEIIEAAKPGMFGPSHSSRVLIGCEVDMSETEIKKLAPDLDVSFVRSFSYAALFYKHVRCGLAHEFHVSESATGNPMTSRDAHISYSNRSSAASPHVSHRIIDFQVGWVAEIIRSIILPFGDAGPSEAKQPPRWWIEGA
jgi:hypothetical protein